ncbi:MAG: sigma-54 dependent transcriptional regulator [Christensenellaceae bacterium]|jgi:two-component system response regulator AtoC|nr:sigma-54 dependent transcriptional regulator [Christensenellaceae bacterium]
MINPNILIIDDEAGICVSLALALQADYNVAWETDPREGMRRLQAESFDLVLLDLMLGGQDGLGVLKRIKEEYPQTAVIMMTAYGSIRSSVEAMKHGAFTYLSKPLDMEELQIHIKQALEFRALNEKVTLLSDALRGSDPYGGIVGDSPAMQQVYGMIEKLKDVDASVTISGESGTGKEMVAKAIHFMGNRANERFVAVNCAAIPEGLLEEEFFGHKRGAFTGAVSDKRGKFDIADKGTVFLDEIGDMPLGMQGKLLRALQERAFCPIGGHDMHRFDARVIVATNRDLKDMMLKGMFRQDLYYRINVIEIKMPPLRERRQDIPLLCERFIQLNNVRQKRQKPILGVTKEVEAMLLAYDYPGNVRELANALEYAGIVAMDEWIHLEDLPARMTERLRADVLAQDPLTGKTIQQLEREAILAAYKRHNGKRKDIAAELGISERNLWNKLKEYGVG